MFLFPFSYNLIVLFEYRLWMLLFLLAYPRGADFLQPPDYSPLLLRPTISCSHHTPAAGPRTRPPLVHTLQCHREPKACAQVVPWECTARRARLHTHHDSWIYRERGSITAVCSWSTPPTSTTACTDWWQRMSMDVMRRTSLPSLSNHLNSTTQVERQLIYYICEHTACLWV